MLAASGVPCALLSGRRSSAVTARAAELGIAHVLQGIENKRQEYEALLDRVGLAPAETGFMGDELVDLPVLIRCGDAAWSASVKDVRISLAPSSYNRLVPS